MSNIGKKIIKGSRYMFIFAILSAIAGYLLRFLLAKNMTVKDFGLFYSVIAFITFFALFKDWGLGSALTKFVSQYMTQKKYDKIKSTFFEILSIQMLSAILFSVVIFFMKDFLAINFFGDSRAGILIIILLGWFILITLADSIFYMFYGLQNFFMYSLRDFMKNTLPLLFVVLFILFGFDYISPAISYMLGIFIVILISGWVLIKKFNFSNYKLSFLPLSDLKKIFSFSFPMMLSTIGGLVIIQMDTLVLTFFRSLEEVGVYNIVLPTSILLIIFGRSFSSVLFPMTSELYAKKKLQQLGVYVSLIYKYLLILILPFALTLFSFSKLFLRFFFSPEYVSGHVALQILLFGTVFFSLALVNNSILLGIGKPYELAKIVTFAAILNLVVNITLIPFFGMIGAAIATSLSYILIFVLGTIKVLKIIKIRSPVFIWLKTIFAGIIITILIYFMKKIFVLNPWLELIFISILGLGIYFLIIFMLRIISIKEVKLLIKQVIIT